MIKTLDVEVKIAHGKSKRKPRCKHDWVFTDDGKTIVVCSKCRKSYNLNSYLHCKQTTLKSLPAGIKKLVLERQGKCDDMRFLHGNGCSLHPDCFTCPYPDCLLRSED